MKLLKLIERLNGIKDKYGDIDVVCYDYSDSNILLKDGIIDDDDINVLFNDKTSSDYVEIGFGWKGEKRSKFMFAPQENMNILGVITGIESVSTDNNMVLLDISLKEKEKDKLTVGLDLFIDRYEKCLNRCIDQIANIRVVQLFEPLRTGVNNVMVLADVYSDIKHLVDTIDLGTTLYVKYKED